MEEGVFVLHTFGRLVKHKFEKLQTDVLFVSSHSVCHLWTQEVERRFFFCKLSHLYALYLSIDAAYLRTGKLIVCHRFSHKLSIVRQGFIGTILYP